MAGYSGRKSGTKYS